MYTHVVVHYGEIAIKGKNRASMERLLISNIKASLKDSVRSVLRFYGRVIIELNEKSKIEEIRKILMNTPGITYFSFAVGTTLDFEKIKKYSVELAKDFKGTFKVEARRSFKQFPLTSQEMNMQLGGAIIDKYGYKVDVKRPDNQIYVEVTEKAAFTYNEKITGIGGMPVGMSGRVVSLLSGGIDSPVASFMMMKRGAKVTFVHFHNYTAGATGVKDKIMDIVKTLNRYQIHSRLWMVPFKDIQLEIIKKIPADHRMIVYKRVMVRIANEIAKKERALGVVMGDSLAQVASQTLENLNSIYNASELNMFSPLIGFDKQEIIDLAKRIGTYESSILPYDDCCTFMVAPHPQTKSKLEDVLKMESNLDLTRFVEEALARAELIKFGE